MFKAPDKVRAIAYKMNGQNWEKYSEVKSDSSSYNLKLNEGKYYLAIAGSGMLGAKTQPFNVLGESDISLKTSLFNTWYVYLITLGLIISITLVVIKYTHKKS